MYKEGKAVIRYTKDSFLNKSGIVSRDISSAFVACTAAKGAKILDTTSATGMRGIRYYLETPSKDITFLEINKKVFTSLQKNIKSNKIKSKPFNTSIQEFANGDSGKFDFIDLDPFGGVTPYIYDLMKVAQGGTYLLATGTDAAVLCGADYKACVRLYDARPMHNELCKEVGLRILIGYIARIAAQFNFGVEMYLSFSYLHYMRVFVRLEHGSKSALETIKKLGYAYYCNGCGYRAVKSSFFPIMIKCKECGKELDVAGKLWTGNLYDKNKIENMLDLMTLDYRKDYAGEHLYANESVHFLRGISNEIDIPLYYSIPKLTGKLGIGAISDKKLVEILGKRGFLASQTHLEKSTIKTNADLEEIIKCVKSLSKSY